MFPARQPAAFKLEQLSVRGVKVFLYQVAANVVTNAQTGDPGNRQTHKWRFAYFEVTNHRGVLMSKSVSAIQNG